MLPHTEVFLRIFTILVLVAINAFFVAAEFAVVSVRRTRVQQLVQEGDPQAKTVQNLQRDIERLLSTTQLGITLSSLALGWMGERAIANMLFSWLEPANGTSGFGTWVAHSVSIPLAFVVIAYLQIVLGELCPKTLALVYAEQFARVLGPISLSISRLFTPLVWILNQSNRQLLRLLRVPIPSDSLLNSVSFKELQLLVESSAEQSDLQQEERELLKNVFESGEILVEEVMVPRTSITAVEVQSTLREFLAEVAATGYDYYPVIEESLDQVRGILYYKDVVRELPFQTLDFDASIQPWIQTAWFIAEGTPIQDVLQMMQKYQLGVVMVRESEFDGTAGLVTLQDLIRAIIGIEDDVPSLEEAPIVAQDNHVFRVQAQTDLELINEELRISIPVLEDYQTLGGFIMYHLQKIPEPGELFAYQNLEFQILSTDGPRLDQVLISITDVEHSSALETEDPSALPGYERHSV